jgi:hypothetical protein
LSFIPLVVVLTVILVPASHFLLLCLLPVRSGLIHAGWLRLLWLRIQVLGLLRHVISSCQNQAIVTGYPIAGVLELWFDIDSSIDGFAGTIRRIASRPNLALNRTRRQAA